MRPDLQRAVLHQMALDDTNYPPKRSAQEWRTYRSIGKKALAILETAGLVDHSHEWNIPELSMRSNNVLNNAGVENLRQAKSFVMAALTNGKKRRGRGLGEKTLLEIAKAVGLEKLVFDAARERAEATLRQAKLSLAATLIYIKKLEKNLK